MPTPAKDNLVQQSAAEDGMGNMTDKTEVFVLDESTCIGCYECVEACPNDVLDSKDGHPFQARPEDCDYCCVCEAICPEEAITINDPDDE